MNQIPEKLKSEVAKLVNPIELVTPSNGDDHSTHNHENDNPIHYHCSKMKITIGCSQDYDQWLYFTEDALSMNPYEASMIEYWAHATLTPGFDKTQIINSVVVQLESQIHINSISGINPTIH